MGFLELIRGRTPDVIVCDPSAASFITLLQSRGFAVTAAKNDVLNGIRMTATALRTGQIKVTKGCVGRGAGVFPLPLGRRRRAGCACEGE